MFISTLVASLLPKIVVASEGEEKRGNWKIFKDHGKDGDFPAKHDIREDS